MNALQPTVFVDTWIKTGAGFPVARHPALAVTEAFLALTLPTGWMLSDGTGCQLDVVRGCLWLTDTRGKDFWLKDGDGVLLTAKSLLTAEFETVVLIRPAIMQNHVGQRRLHVNAKHRRIQLQLTSLSFWQRCSHLFHLNKIFRFISRSNPDHE
jgi:hypothetical protein